MIEIEERIGALDINLVAKPSYTSMMQGDQMAIGVSYSLAGFAGTEPVQCTLGPFPLPPSLEAQLRSKLFPQSLGTKALSPELSAVCEHVSELYFRNAVNRSTQASPSPSASHGPA